MIVLDASVLIAYLDAEDSQHAAAETLLMRAVDDDFAASSLTLAEVLVVPVRDGRLDAVQEVFRDLDLEELPFPPHSAVRLAQLRASTGLKLPDCWVLLAAEDVGARVACIDDRLVRVAESRNLGVVRA